MFCACSYDERSLGNGVDMHLFLHSALLETRKIRLWGADENICSCTGRFFFLAQCCQGRRVPLTRRGMDDGI